MRAVVRYTRNFEANLERIEAFWHDSNFPQGYDKLLDEIGERLIANLEQHPRMGRAFWARKADSVEVLGRIEALRARYGADTDVREYLMADYLVLYVVVAGQGSARAPQADTIYLAAIKHFKEFAYSLA